MDRIGQVTNQASLNVRQLLTTLYPTVWFLLAKASEKSL